jgi:opacity protein-like surface antigen
MRDRSTATTPTLLVKSATQLCLPTHMAHFLAVPAAIEYAFLPNWSAKIEYNFIDFGTHSFNAPVSTVPSLPGTPLAGVTGFPVSITENEHIVKAGVNYRFS